ncbi:MAG: tetraacyldisaccharide 4'-kinase [Candidatus Omnitrophica bacterium CG11_big_fil_rev_8_21_14_0_20_64_10]|nr:MAG: tetraacyldisaccharide 4'-kinase [Candidatus Omnitrophica bacterium CG11_big_fil_rev_8_21_14_0_20_64_10]
MSIPLRISAWAAGVRAAADSVWSRRVRPAADRLLRRPAVQAVGRGCAAVVLTVCAWGVRAGWEGIQWGLRRKWLKVRRLPVPVLSVGNLTWGGTGKTPMVIRLARHFQRQGRRVAVLTRGYGRDEVELMRRMLPEVPVLEGADRFRSGRLAVEDHRADLLILDDGYQQWRLHKDLNLLMVDGAAPFGSGRMMPRGNLREPKREAGRADLIVVSRSDRNPAGPAAVEAELRRFNPNAPIFFSKVLPVALRRWPGGESAPLTRLQGRVVAAFAGIAGPDQFKETLKGLGASVPVRMWVRDHHVYTVGELARLMESCRRRQIGTLVTTAKDAVRLPPALVDAVGPGMKGLEILVLEIEMEFVPDESLFLHRVDSLLAGAGR